MENKKEVFLNRLEDPEFVQKVRDAFITALEEEATKPDPRKRAPRVYSRSGRGGKWRM